MLRKRKKSRRGGKQSKHHRLLDFQIQLCERCGLAPTRLMMKLASHQKGEKIRLTRMRMSREQQGAGREGDLLVYPCLSEQEEVKVEGVMEP